MEAGFWPVSNDSTLIPRPTMSKTRMTPASWFDCLGVTSCDWVRERKDALIRERTSWLFSRKRLVSTRPQWPKVPFGNWNVAFLASRKSLWSSKTMKINRDVRHIDEFPVATLFQLPWITFTMRTKMWIWLLPPPPNRNFVCCQKGFWEVLDQCLVQNMCCSYDQIMIPREYYSNDCSIVSSHLLEVILYRVHSPFQTNLQHHEVEVIRSMMWRTFLGPRKDRRTSFCHPIFKSVRRERERELTKAILWRKSFFLLSIRQPCFHTGQKTGGYFLFSSIELTIRDEKGRRSQNAAQPGTEENERRSSNLFVGGGFLVSICCRRIQLINATAPYCFQTLFCQYGKQPQ